MNLKEIILDVITESGPLPFDDFMRMSLYHPEGFFGGDKLRSEKGGDFLTSPEVSPLFGETLAKFVLDVYGELGDPFAVVEVAAGSGSLLRPLDRALRAQGADLPIVAVEKSPAARDALLGVLPANRVLDDLEDVAPLRGVIIANELVDNLPMAMAQMTAEGWRERWVGADGIELVFVDAPPRPEVLDWLDRYGGDVPENGWVEVQIEAARWLRNAIDRLREGSILLIDYGDTAEGLQPRRQDGTLRTYRAHHLGPHPLDEPGETDITADVNFSALIGQASAADGVEVTLRRQDDFLSDLGLRNRLSEIRRAELAAASDSDHAERLRLRTQKTEAETLLHPRGLGDFRVLRIARRELSGR